MIKLIEESNTLANSSVTRFHGDGLARSVSMSGHDMEPTMAEVHDLIEANGKQGAILAGLNRPVVEAAASYMADEDSGLGFAYSGWAQCALPHKRLADDAHWGITSEKLGWS